MAKKHNKTADEIDLTPFQFVSAGPKGELLKKKPGCGSCHPGGGGMEYDREGHRYDEWLREHPELANSLDGDYHKSKWDRTGVVEGDCFLCHLPGYNFGERMAQLKMLNYKWATVAGSGIGQVKGFVADGEEPVVVYNKHFFNEDGKLDIGLVYPPPSDNCVFCHGMSDLKKRGFSWNDLDNQDVHNLGGMSCTDCHPGDIDHNFAKGDENVSTVRDDLDGKDMSRCQDCHGKGTMGAPRPAHPKVRPDHLEKLACEFCHIPTLHKAAAAGLDVTAGGVWIISTPGSKRVGDRFAWHPRYEWKKKLGDETEKLYPVNLILPMFYTNHDADGIYYPLFARELKKAFEMAKSKILGEREAPEKNAPIVKTNDQIKAMLEALSESLKGNKRFEQIEPHFHHGGRLYSLEGGQLVVEEDHTWVGEGEGFNINHNVAPAEEALGAHGCADCHSDDSHVFKGQVVVSFIGENGEPEYVHSGRLFGHKP